MSREFFCPRCRNSLTMSEAMHALALIHRSGDNYIANVTVDAVTCPACGCDIPVKDIIDGKLGGRGGVLDDIVGCAGAIAMLVGIVYLVRSCS